MCVISKFCINAHHPPAHVERRVSPDVVTGAMNKARNVNDGDWICADEE